MRKPSNSLTSDLLCYRYRKKIHSAPNLRDADNSSSAVIVTRRSASDSIEDPTPPTPPIELQFLDSRSKNLSPLPSNPSRPTLSSTNSSSSTSGSYFTAHKLSRRQRSKLSEEI
ncbi:hypothetical protein HZ326_10434 [Fusarium oxysporum f. sp. albedinis]|nr:hypothetical protein HZ326_10434 [Fusarium oxysporum f. sp. albedinis]